MSFLNAVVLFLFIVTFQSSCGLFSDSTGDDEDPDDKNGPNLETSVECSDSARCKQQCNKLFTTDASLLDKCLDQKSSDVSQINAAFSPMEKANWDSIKAISLDVLVDFDKNIWPKYAGINRVKAREMLLWVAKNDDIADLLDEDHNILRNAFSTLGSTSYDEKVQTGMTEDVDLEENRTFFEVSIHNNNDKAFKAAHELLKEECGENDRFCVREVYCSIENDLVFGTLNRLELGEDADSDGTLNRSDCP